MVNTDTVLLRTNMESSTTKIRHRVSLFAPLAPVHQTGGFAKMHLIALRQVAKMNSASFPK
jgi:hypothetical protein